MQDTIPEHFSVLLFYVLATFKVMSGRELTCDSAHSWRLWSTAPLGDQTMSPLIWYPTQSHFPNTEPTSSCPILIMSSVNDYANTIHICKLSYVPLVSYSPLSLILICSLVVDLLEVRVGASWSVGVMFPVSSPGCFPSPNVVLLPLTTCPLRLLVFSIKWNRKTSGSARTRSITFLLSSNVFWKGLIATQL